MKQLSLFDLPVDPVQDPNGPSLWWPFQYLSIYAQAVADFVGLYNVEPIFFLSWAGYQAFLTHPNQAVIVETDTGRMVDSERRRLWHEDYQRAKAFRPQDVAPQIKAVLHKTMDRACWRPMVMAEIRVPNSKVEALSEKLTELNVFELHWPAFRDAHLFRLFGDPNLLGFLGRDFLAGP